MVVIELGQVSVEVFPGRRAAGGTGHQSVVNRRLGGWLLVYATGRGPYLKPGECEIVLCDCPACSQEDCWQGLHRMGLLLRMLL